MKILSIAPAKDWVCLYEGHTDQTPNFKPVACFALIMEDKTQTVVPMVSEGCSVVPATEYAALCKEDSQ